MEDNVRMNRSRVGMGYLLTWLKFFHEVNEELLRNLIKVNIEGTTKVTQVVLNGMLKRK
ncbi:unnamed protein product [Lupinus luteus]|uniref:Uncharacterized protein n=1 Tax=Lupinus luteus TaxID=3873 RepID=A0AAV1X9Y8_LUPLU